MLLRIFISFSNVTIDLSLELKAALRDNLLSARLLSDGDRDFAVDLMKVLIKRDCRQE